MSRLLTAIAVLHHNRGEILKAIPNSRKAEAFAHLLNDDSIKGDSYGNLGNALVDLEDFAKTPEFYELVLDSFEKTNDLVNKSVTLYNLNFVCGRLNRMDEAYKYLNEIKG